MRKLITALLLGATVLPAAAQAQTGELRRDRREIQEQRRDLRDAYRRGDRDDVRDERRDLRDARQEYREDLRDYRQDRRDDWRDYRDHNRDLYRSGRWNAPFRYNSFRPGVRIAPTYYGQRYWIADPYRYRLPRPYGYQRWVRHYNDVLLIDTRRGVVVDVIRGFFL